MQPNDEVEADAASVETQAATSKETEIVVNNEYITTDTVSYDPETKVFSATYKRGEDDLLKGAVNNIKNSVKVKLGQEENAELKGLLTYKWQKGIPKAEATSIRDYDYSDLPGGELPHDAGAYRYVITLAEDPELCNGATAELYFTVEPCEITPVYEETVKAGTTVADVKKDIRENYTLEADGEELNVFINNEATTIDIIRGYDASGAHGDGTALADTEILRSNEDYTFKITGLTWKTEAAANKDNYTVSDTPVKLTVADNLTKVDVKAAAGLGKVYDEKPIDEADVKSKLTITVGVVDEDGDAVTGEDGKELTVATDPADTKAFKYTWLDANKNEIEKGVQDVKDAGTYYYRVDYLGEEGRYAKSRADVKVVISKAEVYIGDINVSAGLSEDKKEVTVNNGITAGEVLEMITGYSVKNTDAAGQEAEKVWTVDEHFWGVSYNDAGKTQSYEPIFYVQKGTSTKVGETETVKWKNMSSGEALEISEKGDVSYRIVFSGRKAVYNSNGTSGQPSDINEGLKNHTVDITEQTQEAKALKVKLDPATKVEINIDALCNGEAGKTFENPNTRPYNGEQLYKDREYKKLVALKDVSMPSGAYFTYQWDTASEISVKTDKDGKEYLDATWSRFEYNPSEDKDYNHDVEDFTTPEDAGVYKLRITYKDPSHGTYATPVDVYYTIQRKDVYIKLEGTPEPYIGNEIGDFIDRLESTLGTENAKVQYSIWDNPEFTVQDMAQNLKCYEDYDLNWYVERRMKDGSDKYVRCGWEDTFLEGETYRLGVWADIYDGNYNNYWVLDVYNRNELDQNGEPKTYENGVADIKQKVSQGVKLNFTIDWSKIGDKTKVYDGEKINKEAIIEAITVTNAKTGDEITDTSFIQYRWYWSDFNNDDSIYVDEAVHRGTYYLNASVEEDDVYAETWENFGNQLKFTITPAKLVVSPVLKDEVKAGGLYTGSLKDKLDAVIKADPELRFEMETPVASDQTYFAENKKYVDETQFAYPDVFYDASNNIDYFNLIISPKQDDEGTGYLRSSIEYNVRHDGTLQPVVKYGEGGIAFYSYDYEPEFETKSFVPVRAEAVVAKSDKTGTELYDEISGDAAKGYIHTIMPKTAIPYRSELLNVEDEDGKAIPGNYFVFKVTAPKEYTNVPGAAVKVTNNIEKKNGYIVSEGTTNGRKWYEVAFDASGKDTKEFEITWDEGYAETFKVDLTKSILLEDLRRAVVPKSLAFNGASKKMAIGEEQQLDLKITKKQMADTIHIGYESSDETILTVTETGRVTAIAKGKADIIAYAAYEDEEGNTVAFRNAKGGYEKSAKLSITVSKVTEVKNIKIDVRDSSVYLDYAKPVDGYRREIYVMEDKKTADDFEAAIKAVDHGNYDAFAHSPIFKVDDMGETPFKNGKNFKYRTKITGLGYGKTYTLYVRNVSGIRTLDNGEKITLADSWAGSAKTVKTFTTTLPQDWRLRTSFDTSDTSPVKYGWDDEKEGYVYYTNVASKKVPLLVEGQYPENESWSEKLDYLWYPLPHGKKTTYVEPKLTYVIADDNEFIVESVISEQIELKAMGMAQTGNLFYWPSSKATIDKNGKITPKDVGYIYACAYDPLTEKYSYTELKIVADANVLTGKAINLKVGNTVDLSKYLTYKQDKIVLPGYGTVSETVYDKRDLELSCVPDAAPHFAIDPDIEENGRIDDYKITAKQPGGNVVLTVTDKTVKANGGADAVIKLKVAAIDPVKKLKAAAHYDKAAVITFDYTALRDKNLKFRLEVKDQSGKILQNRYIEPDYIRDYKKQIDHFSYEIIGLTRLSSYSLTVTAVYESFESKAASARFKTTNIPASTIELKNEEAEGGIDITVRRIGEVLGAYPILKTGNMYVLDAKDVENGGGVATLARAMKTDTLTWKSSNTKVATVKANTGSYTATLKAVKRGFTKISVTSKITKKVIARYTVFVNAMNEADGYYGDHIEHWYGKNEADDEVSGIDVLTLGNPFGVKLEKGESKLLSFTAPYYGNYTFSGAPMMIREKGKKDYTGKTAYTGVEKGTKYYILVSGNGNVTVTGTEYKELPLEGAKVASTDNVYFIAPEADYYTFRLVKDGKTVAQVSQWLAEEGRFSVKVGDCFDVDGNGYTLQIDRSAVLAQNTDTSIDLEAKFEKWYSFKADKAGLYTISTKDAQEEITAAYSIDGGVQNLIDHAKDGKNVVSDLIKIEKDQTVYVRLASGNKAAKATLRIDRAEDLVAGTPKTVKITKDADAEEGTETLATETFTFVADKDSTYNFAAAYTKADDLKVTFTVIDPNGKTHDGQDAYGLTLTKGDLVKIEVTANKADTEVTVSVTENAPKELKVGAEEKADVSMAGQKITFTALEAGWYNFGFVQEDAKETVTGTITTGKAKAGEELGFTEGKASEAIYLKAGETVTIWLYSESAKATVVKVTVTLEEVKELAAGTVPVKAGQKLRYQWTAKNDGLYTFGFEVKSGAANIFISTSPSTEGNIFSSPVTLTSKYANGDKRYVTFTATEDASIEVKLTEETVDTIVASTTKDVELDGNGYKWLSFTAKANARYRFSQADADSFVIRETTQLAGAEMSSPFGSSNNERVLSAGAKCYYKVTNISAEKKTVKLTISAVTAKDAAVGASVTETVKKPDRAWFKFTATESGRYQFTAKAKQGEEEADAAIASYMDIAVDGNSTILGTGSLVVLRKNEVRYLRVTAPDSFNATDDITITFTAAKKTGEAITTDKGLELKANEAQYLEFNVTEDGIYTVSAKSGDAVAAGVTVKYYKNLNAGESGPYTLPYSFAGWKKDDKIVLAVTSATDQSVTVNIKKETVTPLTAGEAKSCEIQDGDALYFEMNIDEVSRYFVETLDVAEGLNLTVSRLTGNVSNASVGYISSGYVSYVGTPRNKVIYKVTATGAPDAKKSFKIGYGLVVAKTMTAGAVDPVKDLAPGHMSWYSFTPEEEGTYVVKAKGTQIYGNVSGNINYGFSLYGSNLYERVVDKEDVGKELFYAVRNSGSEKKDVDFTVYKATPKELSEGSDVEVDVTKVDANEKVWIHFKAPADGRYTFAQDCTGASISTTLVESSKKGISFGLNTEICMDKEDEITFTVWYNNVTSEDFKNFKVSVANVKPETLQEGTAKTYEGLNGSTEKWIAFTADKTAQYKFELTGCNAYMYEKISSTNITSYLYSGTTCRLAAGQTVYIKLTTYNYVTSASIKVSLDEELVQLTTDNGTVSGIEGNGSKWAYFTAPEMGHYSFTAEDGCTAEIYRGNNYAGGLKGSSWECNLEEGDTLFLVVYNNDEETASKTITIQKTGDILTLTSASPLSVKKPEGQRDVWLKFTVEDKGTYMISRSDTEKGYSMYLYDDINAYEHNYIKYGWNMLIVDFEQAGSKYIKVSGDTAEDIYTLTLAKHDVVELEGTAERSIRLAKDETVLLKYTAYDARYTFAFNASNAVTVSSNGSSWNTTRSSWTVNEESELYLLLTGLEDDTTVNITAQVYSNRIGYVSFNNTSESRTLNFSRNEGGRYVISLPSYTRISDSNISGLEEYGQGSGAYPCYTCYLNAGTQYSLTIVSDGGAMDDEYDVYASRLESGRTLTTNSYVYVGLHNAQETWIDFKAPSTGKYTFYSTTYSELDTYLVLYVNGVYRDANDDGDNADDGRNFRLSGVELEEGDEVVLRTYCYGHGTSSGYYYVHAEQDSDDPLPPKDEYEEE